MTESTALIKITAVSARISDESGLNVLPSPSIIPLPTSAFTAFSAYAEISDLSVYDDKSSKAKGDGALKYKEQKRLQKQNQVRLSSKEKQELESMESIILDLEEQIEIFNEQMNEYQNDFKKLTELSNQRDHLTEQLEAKNERWLELLEKQEKSQN